MIQTAIRQFRDDSFYLSLSQLDLFTNLIYKYHEILKQRHRSLIQITKH